MRYPVLRRPIPSSQLAQELAALLIRAGIDPRKATIAFPVSLEVVHRQNPRRYAQVTTDTMAFEFATATLRLHPEHRLGLLAHEVGHVICPGCDEDGADAAARRALGVRIGYDTRWPGKGLQVAM